MIRNSSKIFVGAFFVLVLAPVFVSAATMGEGVAFQVDSSYDTKSRTTVKATLRVEGENAHYYVEDEYWQALTAEQTGFANALQELSREFDTQIYPREREVFGLEPNPGIDGDTKITVLVTPLVADAGGYFLLGNGLSQARHPQSNEREMVYLNAASYRAGRWREFLAHEFQHLITFGAKENRLGRNEDVWLNELRSEYAVTAVGYDDATQGLNVRLRAQAFSRAPHDPLLHWGNENADYGAANLFGQYLSQTYGTKMLRETIDAGSVGIAAVEEVLKTRGLAQSFEDVYRDWVVTNFVGGYKSPYLENFRLAPTTMYNLFGTFQLASQESVGSWGIKAVGVRSAEAGLELTLTASPNESWLLLVIKKDNPNERVLTYRFSGAKTIQLPLATQNDQNLIVVAINITDRQASREGGPRTVPYTLTMKTLGEVAASTPMLPSPVPSPTPTPTPTPEPRSPRPTLPDGTLIRERGDSRVWIIQGEFLRHLSHPAILGMYRHLKWEDVVEVEPGTLSQFLISRLIRAQDDPRVYEIDAAGMRRWLNMTPEQFAASGRFWEAVYVTNVQERDFYPTGAPL